jgi:hypothetical protein
MEIYADHGYKEVEIDETTIENEYGKQDNDLLVRVFDWA